MIPLNEYLLFLSIVTLIVVSPGVNLFLLLQATPVHGRLAGFSITLGFCAAIMTHATLALIGLGTVILASATLFTTVKIAGAAYLIWLGVKAFSNVFKRTPVQVPLPKESAFTRSSRAQLFARGYLTNLLNPKPAIFYVAAFPQFLDVTNTNVYWLAGLGMGISHASIALIFYSLVVVSLDKVASWLRRPTVWTSVQAVSGVAFFLLGGRILLTRPSV
ncbi:LysE family translocator [Vreelandella sp. EE27]